MVRDIYNLRVITIRDTTADVSHLPSPLPPQKLSTLRSNTRREEGIVSLFNMASGTIQVEKKEGKINRPKDATTFLPHLISLP